MHRYEPSIPRIASGIAAVAMTAITIGVAVIMPAQIGPGSDEPRMLAASEVSSPASTSAFAHVAAAHESGSSMIPCVAQVEPQALGQSKAKAHFHASHVCCPAAQGRAHRRSMEAT